MPGKNIGESEGKGNPNFEGMRRIRYQRQEPQDIFGREFWPRGSPRGFDKRRVFHLQLGGRVAYDAGWECAAENDLYNARSKGG